MTVAADRRAAAHQNMLAQKERGEWDATKGDISARIGPLPIPDGYRCLSEVCDRWTTVTLAAMTNPSEQDRIETAERSVSAVLAALVDGNLQAFAVAPDHRVSRIPSTLWLHLSEDAGGAQNAMTTMVDDCLTGAAFEPHYVGNTGVVEEAAFQKIRLVASAPDAESPSARPWEAFNSLKAWLSDPVAATRFADALLATEGVPVCDESARRRVLLQYLGDNGRSLTKDSLAAMRRHGNHS